MNDVAAAIRTIEECQQTHALWIDWYDRGNPTDEVAGDREHHERINREYDNVLSVLRNIA